MKTDCWRIAFPSSSPPPTPTVVAQFPGLLRDESPSCHNSSVNLHIVYAEFLPAGDAPGGLQVLLAVHRAAAGVGGLTRIQASGLFPSLSAGCQTVSSLPVPFYFSSCLLYLCLLLSPLPPPQNLEMDGGFLVRTWDGHVQFTD